MEKKEYRVRKKLKRALLTTTAAASLFVNNTYDSPFEIIDDTMAEETTENQEETNEKKTYKNTFKKYLGKLPITVRALVVFPLWFIGYGLMAILTPLYNLFIEPYMGQITYWGTFILFFLLVALVAVLFVFPGLPLSKTFNKKRIKLMVIALILLALTNEILPYYYPEYQRYSTATKAVTIFVILATLLLDCYLKNRKVKLTLSTDKLSFSNED